MKVALEGGANVEKADTRVLCVHVWVCACVGVGVCALTTEMLLLLYYRMGRWHYS